MDDSEHPNEAIFAVVDEGFIGEDDDEDYEDLYNDVNVGENFLQSLNQNDDVSNQEPEKQPDPPPTEVPPENPKLEREDVHNSRVPDPVEEVQKSEDRADDVAPPCGEMRINLGQPIEQPPVVNANGNFSNQAPATNVVNPRQGVTLNGGAYGSGGGSGGGTMLFVGDLHWWTTDAELEAELCKFGTVKEIRFFDEKASGKSKGYAQVEFFDSAVAMACKDNMNGFVFNGRPCVVAFASPFSIKRMGEAQLNRTTQGAAAGAAQGGGGFGHVRRGPGDGPMGMNKPMGNNVAPSASYQGGGDVNNNSNICNRGGYGRGNWGRGGGQGIGGRGQMRNRPGGMMGRGMMGNGFGVGPPMMPPQAMMGQGFDSTFGGPMARMGGYGGFPGGPTPPFPGMMSSFPSVAPHVNPAFFGRGMGMNGMGMMSSSGVDNSMGMWPDPNIAESSYGGEEAVSDHQYGGEMSRDRGAGRMLNAMREEGREYRDERDPEYEREKEASQDQEWQERRHHHREERDVSRERDREQTKERSRERERDVSRERGGGGERGRDRYRGEERERYSDHHNRYKDREPEYEDEWERGRSSRTHSKLRLSQEDGQHFRSRESEYSKRRRLTSE